MINRKLIRQTLREVGCKADVDFVRKVRDNVHARIKGGEVYCHICTSADSVSRYNDGTVRNIMANLINAFGGGSTLESIGQRLHKNRLRFEPADDIRKVVLQELIDLNRNRKGAKGVKC